MLSSPDDDTTRRGTSAIADAVRAWVDHGVNRQLFKAAELGDTAAASKLLRATWFSRAADVNWRNESVHHMAPLHVAAICTGSAEMVRILLQAGADVGARDQMHWTPLHWAAQEGHTAVMRVLLEAGADVDAMNDVGWTPLHCVARKGSEDGVWALLEAGADVAARNKNGETPLHWAARQGHLDTVRVLLRAGADVNVSQKDGFTAMQVAAGAGHVEVVRVLLEAGASLGATDQEGWTPLHWATLQGQAAAVQALLQAGADANMPLVATSKGRQVELMPLPIAAISGHVEVMRMLLQAGADVRVANHVGFTPLHLAAKAGHLEAVRVLLQQTGVDMGAEDKVGWTPLHYAASGGHVEVVRVLLQAGAEVGAKSQDGKTPLEVAGGFNGISEEKKACVPAVREALKVAARWSHGAPAGGSGSRDMPKPVAVTGNPLSPTAPAGSSISNPGLLADNKPPPPAAAHPVSTPSVPPASVDSVAAGTGNAAPGLLQASSVRSGDDNVGGGQQGSSGPKCVVCLEAPREYVLVPCGHLLYCKACSATAAAQLACAVCRAPVERCLQVFSS